MWLKGCPKRKWCLSNQALCHIYITYWYNPICSSMNILTLSGWGGTYHSWGRQVKLSLHCWIGSELPSRAYISLLARKSHFKWTELPSWIHLAYQLPSTSGTRMVCLARRRFWAAKIFLLPVRQPTMARKSKMPVMNCDLVIKFLMYPYKRINTHYRHQ